MDDLERRIREANPNGVDRSTPLSARAEADLVTLLATPAVPAITVSAVAVRRRPRLAISLLSGMVAALVIGVVIVTGALIPEPPASAAGLPLLGETPVDGTVDEVIDRMIMSARKSSEEDATGTRRTAYEAWSASILVGEEKSVDVFVQPVEVERAWSADLSGRIVTRAGAVVMGALPRGEPSYEPGDVIDDSSFAPGEYPLLFPEAPPATGEALRAYLAGVFGLTEATTTGEWFSAIGDLRTDWPLSSKQNLAVLELVKTLPGVTATSVTDRIGRHGIALQTESRADGGFRDLLIFDSRTGVLNSAESVYLGGLTDIDLPAMTVLNYTAWKNPRS